MHIEFHGAAREVTGSCFLFQVGRYRFLVDCGLIQGSPEHERKNREPLPFSPRSIDAVVLTHAHLDHAGRLPVLIKEGFRGFIYTHRATAALCRVMLEDAAYLNEKEAERHNRFLAGRGKPRLEPLFDRDDVYTTERHFHPLEYGQPLEILPGVTLALHDAGHILGSAIVELTLRENGLTRRVVVSGDLGHRGAPILPDPTLLPEADFVVMETTYGDRCHRPWEATWAEMGEIIGSAHADKGNILVPAFAVGRTQELLYVLARHYEAWNLRHWHVFLDSPMAIEATALYRQYRGMYDKAAREVASREGDPFNLPNLRLTRTAEESMRINDIRAGALIIAGSGMCTGGRIVHHLKRNLPFPQAHVLIVGFQAQGTPGRALVDGAKQLHLFGEDVPVRARVHTVGGLSAHADQAGLAAWYGHFRSRPPVALVHGEPTAMDAFARHLETQFGARVHRPLPGQRLSLDSL
ncbi:MAG: MBL fold metallo-hydrolase [Burkholderiales bacterium]|nr:MBL fold metallo-hydrolase [Burkholderiales bacterium]